MLSHSLKKWQLDNPELLTKTPRAQIYKVQREDGPAVLKIYTQEGAIDEANAAPFLRLCDGRGMARLLDHDPEALLLEYLDGPRAESLSLEGRDDEALEIMAGVLNQIHAVPLPDQYSFKPLKHYFRALFEQAETQDNPLYKKAADLAEHYLAEDIQPCLLHGDMHHENVMHHSARGWLAIDPKGIVGDRAYDAANILHNPNSHRELFMGDETLLKKRAKILAKHMALEEERLLGYSFIHGCLSATWCSQKKRNQEFVEFRLGMSAMIARVLGI